jgi:hypothetical protein
VGPSYSNVRYFYPNVRYPIYELISIGGPSLQGDLVDLQSQLISCPFGTWPSPGLFFHLALLPTSPPLSRFVLDIEKDAQIAERPK